MLESFFVPFVSILLAEFGDKSQISLLLLSSRTKHHMLLFLGAMMGFLLVDGVAIAAGGYIREFLPESVLRLLAGWLFIIFGILTFRSDQKEAKKMIHAKNALFVGFAAIALSEWGDKTQLASAAFATQFQPLPVFVGIMCALAILSFIAVRSGKWVEKKVKRSHVAKISGALFVIIGIATLLF